MKRALLALALLLTPALAFAQNTNQAPGGGAKPKKYISAATNNATLVKAGASTLWDLQVINTTTTLYYLKFYDKATAPTCGTDTPLKTLPVPFGTSNAGGGIATPFPVGVSFVAGMGFCLVANSADNDNTSAATGVIINLDIK